MGFDVELDLLVVKSTEEVDTRTGFWLGWVLAGLGKSLDINDRM